MPASEPGAGSPRWQTAIAAGLAFSLLTLLAFPPFDLWPLVLLSPLPLIWVAVGESRRFTPAGQAFSPVGQASRLPTAPRSFRRRVWQTGRRTMRTPLLVSLGVLPLWVFQEWWLLEVTGPGFIPMVILESMISGLFVWCVARLHARAQAVPLALLAAIIWTSLELFRGDIAFTGYPWLFLAHPLIEVPTLALPAAAFGVYFVSFLIAGLAGLIIEAWRRRSIPIISGAVLAVLLALGFALGARPLGEASPPLRIAVVQTNTSVSNKLTWTQEQRLADLARFLELTREAARAQPDLIVWPETMFPGEALDPHAVEELRRERIIAPVDPSIRPEGYVLLAEYTDRLLALQQELAIPMVVGSVGYENLRIRVDDAGRPSVQLDHRYNSAFLIHHGQVTARYDKIKLTPFGEIMPYIHHWGWLQERLLAIGARGMKFDLSAGKAPILLELDTDSGGVLAIATPICFEATDSGVVRELALDAYRRRLPLLLLNLTNDGWFGSVDSGRWQHLQGSRWRAVELGAPLVRAANTGVSSAFDARGRAIAIGIPGQAPERTEGVLIAEVSPRVPETFFMRVGNLFAWLVLLAAIVLLFVAHRDRLARPAPSRA